MRYHTTAFEGQNFRARLVCATTEYFDRSMPCKRQSKAVRWHHIRPERPIM